MIGKQNPVIAYKYITFIQLVVIIYLSESLHWCCRTTWRNILLQLRTFPFKKKSNHTKLIGIRHRSIINNHEDYSGNILVTGQRLQ